jgi:hypothetical protein
MALFRVKGAPVIRVTATNDATTEHIVVRGYNYSHTAAGSFTLVPGVLTTTNAILIDRVTTTVNAKTVMFPKGQEITLPDGFKMINLTGTLLLYV